MNHRAVAAGLLLVLTVALAVWGQLIPERNPENATSPKSLRAQPQDLTEKIDRAKSRGRDISRAEAERVEAEEAMQQGNDQEALHHFQAGERALK